MALSPAPFDATRCPLCGRSNQCALATGGAIQDCWCLQTPVDPTALASLPAEERDQRCLCPACAAGARREDEGR